MLNAFPFSSLSPSLSHSRLAIGKRCISSTTTNVLFNSLPRHILRVTSRNRWGWRRKQNYQVQWSYFQKCHKSDLLVLELLLLLLLQPHCSRRRKTFAFFMYVLVSHTHTHIWHVQFDECEREEKIPKKIQFIPHNWMQFVIEVL